MKISAAIITLNEERKLARTLTSIKEWVDEIVIVDSGSTDETHNIATKFGAKFIYNKWLGYGEQRNFAISQCQSEWILCIDADEVVTPILQDKLIQIINSEKNYQVYSINRKCVCFGHQFKYGEFGSSYAMRLFKKGSGVFDEAEVHESFVTKEKIVKLNEKYFLQHYSYENMEEYLTRFNKYTSLAAIQAKRQNKNVTIPKILFSAPITFFKFYFIKLGILDGIYGFVMSVMSSIYPLIKYFKLKEINEANERNIYTRTK